MLKKALKLPGLIILIAGFWLGFMPDAESAADDFNGDGRADLAVYTVASGKWFVQALSGAAVVWDKWLGEAAVKMSIPVSGDYDGDRTSDLAVYSLSERKWYIKTLSGNDIPNPKEFPQELPMGEYVPVPGDYDGDKASDPALYELNTGKWYIYSLAKKRKVLWGVNWGFKGGIPVPGDYNRDGVDDLAIYQESTGSWYIVNISGGKVAGWIISAPGKLGGPRKKAVSGDFDGDGYSDLAVYDVDTGRWFIYSIPTNKAIAWYRPWGFKGAVPVSGNYDGIDGDDLAVYDLKNGKWYIQSLSGTNILWNRAWGGKGMAP
ncbi:MAG: VCBS repeat-containing protein, partial [Candidatus Omnitrophica bacterium]|nr:VCBS repeat-containing protein [Candidatus Omnitrophota bacterium]